MLLHKWRLLVAVATVAIALIIWSSSLSPKKPAIALQSIRFNYWNVTIGEDSRGVTTGLLSFKTTIKLQISNADRFWGYHMNGFMTMDVFLRHIAMTKIDKFYEPRKTTSNIVLELRSDGVPLYGASPAVAYKDSIFYIIFEAAFNTEAGLLPFMYKYTYTDIVSCRLTGVSVGTNQRLAIVSTNSCPHVNLVYS